MTGTEKQIKYAQDLMDMMNTHFDNLIADCKVQRPEFVSEWENIRDTYNKHMNEAYAGCVIDLLCCIKESNYQKFYISLYNRTKFTADKMCKAIKADLPKIF